MGPKLATPVRSMEESNLNRTLHRHPSIHSTDKRIIVKALYDLNTSDRSNGELNFKKDDLFKVLNDKNEDWWWVESLASNKVGYIPSNYFAVQDSIYQNAWFHGPVGRKECEKLLNRPGNEAGTFLIRESESIKGTYSLSLLSMVDGEKTVKHYHLRKMDSGSWYISTKNSFESLESLIAFYTKHTGLQCRLGRACSKFKPILQELSKSTIDKWEIDRKTLELVEKIGSGNFGEVWKGVWKKKITVAVKMLKAGVTEKDLFLKEATVMKRLRHPKLVRLYAVCTDEEPLYIVTEYMVNGCLHKILKKDKGKTIKWAEILEFASQIAQGMSYIESQGYIHRDLATRNILVDEYMLLKIGDFGLTRALLNEDAYNIKEKTKFPVKWTAIEGITTQTFTIKSDVWSFGILLVELFTYAETPYPGLSNSEVIKQLTAGSYRHPKPASCPDSMYDLMLSCWHKEPAKRPTFDYLYTTLNDFYVSTQDQYVS